MEGGGSVRPVRRFSQPVLVNPLFYQNAPPQAGLTEITTHPCLFIRVLAAENFACAGNSFYNACCK